jgi:hypothetical protein
MDLAKWSWQSGEVDVDVDFWQSELEKTRNVNLAK